MEQSDIEKLAKLSRLSLKDEEKESFLVDFNSILDYVSEVESAPVGKEDIEAGPLCNVMREDNPPHEGALYTERLLHDAPKIKDNFVQVKQVFE